ncbi:death ligand signal enhancer isoform X2 [Esox lucius]|uniref:death ligand signal enhancer isoform X2 n=1 Tax=Esox lucius TaxID=8010 RepID=UPI00097344C4|nr:death ligand signal enhancer isoform X2 [Esox lucius]
MWRVQGLVGRVLSRCHVHTPLRLTQNHHVEDEVINNSTVLSTGHHLPDNSSQKEEDGDKRRKQRTSQFCYAGLPRYTALDAVGWGAAAMLLMQICRRIHSQFSGADPNSNTGRPASQGTLQRCGYRVLLEILTRRDVLPRGRSVRCLSQIQLHSQQDLEQGSSSSNDSSPDQLHDDHLNADSLFTDHQGANLSQDSTGTEESWFEPFLSADGTNQAQGEHPEQHHEQHDLEGAAKNLQQVAESSVPVVLNIIGLESAKAGDFKAAFLCFLASARQGYCKAQFNTGVCYDKGRGVHPDREKAHHFYSQAAAGGHSQAQYRCAKFLLRPSRGQLSTQRDLDKAISLLQQAASAGLREEPVRDGRKAVHYLKMAAESGDSEALLFLGQCYETGFGVPRCFCRAVGFYQRAAEAGNSQAKRLLTRPCGVDGKVVLRSIRSSPCLSVADWLRGPLSGLPPPGPPPSRLPLHHSWSTGSLGAAAAVPSLPLQLHPPPAGSERHAVMWTVGLG